jgi:pyruvate/2-oxoglutarate dehydrogenase complex dihydrolipoamide acyltransferase (E2) component
MVISRLCHILAALIEAEDMQAPPPEGAPAAPAGAPAAPADAPPPEAPPAAPPPPPEKKKKKKKKKKPKHPTTNVPCPKGAHWNADTARCEVLPRAIQWDIKKARDASDQVNLVTDDKGINLDRHHGTARRLHQYAADRLQAAGFFKLAKRHQKQADRHEKGAATQDQKNAISDPRPPRSFNRKDDGQRKRGRAIAGGYGYRPTFRD